MINPQAPTSTFKTLTPRDPDYMPYMMGEFSSVERALPQPSLNPHSINEIVTFEIKKIENLDSAPLREKLWLLLKPQSWLTVLVPLVMIANMETRATGGVGFVLACVLLLLMVFANWQADLADHLEGWDRLQGGNNKSVLQNGWYTGHQLKSWSRYLLGGAFLLGISLVMKFLWVLVPYSLAVSAILLLLPRWWRKSLWPGLSSFCIFLLTGPLLTIGIDLSFDGHFSWSSLFLGISWGLWMSFGRQQKIYTKQWYLYQKQAPYFFLGLGFDRSKALMRLLIPTVSMAMVFFTILVSGGAAWFFPLLVVHSAFVILELQYNEKVQSSIGSSLQALQQIFNWHHYAISLVMIMGSIIWKTTL